jgi:hypothetical protein
VTEFGYLKFVEMKNKADAGMALQELIREVEIQITQNRYEIQHNKMFVFWHRHEKNRHWLQKKESGLPFEINKMDVVKLVREAWKVGFSRVETNWKAVLHRGWGPKALNMNVLRNPEIKALMPNVSIDLMGRSQGLNSKMLPTELNITEGLQVLWLTTLCLEATNMLQKEVVFFLRSESGKRLPYLQVLGNLVLAWMFLSASNIARK